ncbi:MAG: TonB-dependent receptor, partial [Deltaproteobacteria bacterium]|nr:TonB-dependent receptor [Deltaproteobacteria bacterium]
PEGDVIGPEGDVIGPEGATPPAPPPVPAAPPAPPARGAWLLEKVSVIGDAEKLTRVSGSAHRVDQETLEEQEYDDVHRVLKQVPGVYVRDEDGQGLRPNIGLRGANSDRSAKVTLLEDGVLMAPAPYAAPAAYYFPLTTRLTGVEVFKGPASIQHGPQTLGGAINLLTRPAPLKGMAGGLDLSLGMYDTAKTHGFFGYGWERVGVLVEGARLASDGFKELDGGGGTGFDKREAMLKLRLNGAPDAEVFHKLELKLGYADEVSEETYLGLTQGDFDAAPYRRYAASQRDLMSWWRTQAKLAYTAAVGDNLDVSLTVYRHDFSRVWEKVDDLAGTLRLTDVLRDPAAPRHRGALAVLRGEASSAGVDEELLIGRNDRAYVSQGAQLAVEWRLKPQGALLANTLTAGARVHHDSAQRAQDQRVYALTDGALVPQGAWAPSRYDLGEASALSAYVFDQLSVGERFRLTPGVRVERYRTTLTDTTAAPTSSDNEGVALLPGVGAWLSLGDSAGLLAGVHRGFSPLAPGLTRRASPELSLNYEAGARWELPALSGELIGFYNDYSNLVGTCTQSSGCEVADLDAQFNGGRAGVLGAELSLGTALRLPAAFELRLSGSYTFTYARFLSSFTSGFAQWGEVRSGDILPYLPAHQGSARLGLARGPFGLGAVWTYVGEMRDRAGAGALALVDLVPAQGLLDLSGHCSLSERARVYVTLDNALNSPFVAARRPFGARPSKPLLLRVGYKYEF